MAAAVVVAAGVGLAPSGSLGSSPSVLLVGPTGTPGAQFTSIQDAVNHAAAGDWVLVAPGVYHEHGNDKAGVYITTPGLHLRGMDRNQVIVDGTRFSASSLSGTAPAGSPSCSNISALQDFGSVDPNDSTKHLGRNGIDVWKTDGTYTENLTVCNYLGGESGSNGNEIWWNGGDGSGHIAMHSFWGSYLSATSTYYKDNNSAMGKYGIFASNESGPGLIDNTYSSNMGDSAYYIGACPDCNVILRHAHAESSALAYSGSNGSGRVIIELGEMDYNKTGIVPNTLNNDDWPSPQTGDCSLIHAAPPDPQAHNCFVIRNNHVHHNNNPDTPLFGLAGQAPIGAGIELSGTQFDSVINNVVDNNAAWGIVDHDYPDTGTPPAENPNPCSGGINSPGVCYYTAKGNEVAYNKLSNNGSFGNTGNGDIANEALTATSIPSNCFHDNVDTSGTVTSDPPMLNSLPCSGPTSTDTAVVQLVCASSVFGQCPHTRVADYPTHDGSCANNPYVLPGSVLTPAGDQNNGVCIAPLAAQTTMPDACSGVPANAYCPAAAVSSGSGGLPSTAAGGLGSLVLPVSALALGATLATATWRRRRRLRRT